jgi:hypothetical protein
VKLSGSSFGRAISESQYGNAEIPKTRARWHGPRAGGGATISNGKRLKMQIHLRN